MKILKHWIVGEECKACKGCENTIDKCKMIDQKDYIVTQQHCKIWNIAKDTCEKIFGENKLLFGKLKSLKFT